MSNEQRFTAGRDQVRSVMDRRDLFSWTTSGIGAAALASLLVQDGVARAAPVPGEASDPPPHLPARAKRVVPKTLLTVFRFDFDFEENDRRQFHWMSFGGWIGHWLILFVLLTGAASNIAQFYVSGPAFGGMSGVVYALLGYVWMQSKFNPWSPFVLHKVTVQMMLIWLVLGFTGIIGGMANFAHLGGLAAGVAWGYIDARRAGQA